MSTFSLDVLEQNRYCQNQSFSCFTIELMGQMCHFRNKWVKNWYNKSSFIILFMRIGCTLSRWICFLATLGILSSTLSWSTFILVCISSINWRCRVIPATECSRLHKAIIPITNSNFVNGFKNWVASTLLLVPHPLVLISSNLCAPLITSKTSTKNGKAK